MSGKRIDGCLICGGKYHDFDFARLELLRLLHEHERIRVSALPDYHDVETIAKADFLITYTCDVAPDDAGLKALKKLLGAGKRWFALHGTNSIISWLGLDPPLVAAPRTAPAYMAMLGSQFIAHPPIAEFKVHVSAPDHPLVQGIDGFTTVDELYLQEYHGEHQALLHCYFKGSVPGFEESDWQSGQRHLVFYLHPYDRGEVLYLTLGHCRGKYDMQPLMEEYPQVDRCSWELPVYHELLRRGIRWASGIE